LSRIVYEGAACSRFEMVDFEAEARRQLDEARAGARSIVASARAEAEGIKEKARADGYAAGLKEGGEVGLEEGRREGMKRAEEDFAARSKELSAVLEGLLSEFALRREKMLEQLRSDALDFLIACAERIVRREVAIDRAAVKRALQEGIELVTSAPVRVEAHATDIEFLRRIIPEVMSEKPVEGVLVAAGDGLEPGDVRLVHPEGMVDLTLKAQFEVIRAAFMEGGNGAV